jgi:hypothetical protein
VAQSFPELISFSLSELGSGFSSTSSHVSSFQVPLDLGRSIGPESLVAAQELSHPRWQDGECSGFTVSVLLTDHGGDIVWFLQVVPSWG